MSASCLFCVVTFMPGATGVVHEAGKPFMPSICTRHRRQEPNASSCSVAHSLGIFTSVSAAARITEVPSGTVTSWPSMVSVTSFRPVRSGVPRSCSTMDNMDLSSGAWRLSVPVGVFDKIFVKMVQGGNHGKWRQTAQRAQGAIGQSLAQIPQNDLLLRRILARDQPVDHFNAPGRADAAGSALAAGLDGAE